MSRFLYIIMVVAISGLLAACGDDKVRLVEEGKELKINEKLVETDEVEIIAKSIVKEKNNKEQDIYTVLFDVTNKYNEEIIVKVESVTFDGDEIDSALFSMRSAIKAKDEKELVLNITDFDGYELSELQKEIELDVRVFSWTDPDFTGNHKVKLKL